MSEVFTLHGGYIRSKIKFLMFFNVMQSVARILLNEGRAEETLPFSSTFKQ